MYVLPLLSKSCTAHVYGGWSLSESASAVAAGLKVEILLKESHNVFFTGSAASRKNGIAPTALTSAFGLLFSSALDRSDHVVLSKTLTKDWRCSLFQPFGTMSFAFLPCFGDALSCGCRQTCNDRNLKTGNTICIVVHVQPTSTSKANPTQKENYL